MFKLTETEEFDKNYCYCEEYNDYKSAYNRMLEMYREVAIEGNSEAIECAEIYERSAFVELNNGNVIEWDIEEF